METVEVRIPKSLYARIEKICKESNCSSVDELIVKMLREKASEIEEELYGAGVSEEERKAIIERLKQFGYL